MRMKASSSSPPSPSSLSSDVRASTLCSFGKQMSTLGLAVRIASKRRRGFSGACAGRLEADRSKCWDGGSSSRRRPPLSILVVVVVDVYCTYVRTFFLCLFCKGTSQTKGKGDRKRPQEGATPHPSTDDGRCWLNRRAAHPARLSAAAVGCCCCCCCSLPHRYSPLLCALYRLTHSQSILWKPQKRKRPTPSLWHLFFSFSFFFVARCCCSSDLIVGGKGEATTCVISLTARPSTTSHRLG